MSQLRWIVPAVLLLCLAPSASATQSGDEANSCEVDAVAGGVACSDDTGDRVWEIVHPSMWEVAEDFIEGKTAAGEPLEPIEMDDRFVYAWSADLLVLDANEKRLVDRVRFPAPVVALNRNEKRLEVTVSFEPEERAEFPSSYEVTIPYAPETPAPAQTLWTTVGGTPFLQTQWDADRIARSADDPNKAIEALEQARRADPTNPFLSIELGRLFDEQGNPERANDAYDTAVDAKNPVWADLLAASSVLEEEGASQQADRAFTRGLALMERTGISPQRIVNMVTVAYILRMPPGEESPVHRAIAAGEPREADRLLDRLFRFAPNVEFGHLGWAAAARWMRSHDEPELAEKWSRRAHDNRQLASSPMEEAILSSDRGLLALSSAALALVLIAFLIGLRGGVERRRIRKENGPDHDSTWMPRIRIRDLVVPFVLFASLGVIYLFILSQMHLVNTTTYAPLGTTQDSLASPEVIDWFESLDDSPQRDLLLDIARTELDAIEAGRSLPEKQSVAEYFVDALRADARQQAVASLWSQNAVHELPEIIPRGPVVEPGPTVLAIGFLVLPLVVLAFVLAFGAFLGSRAPKMSRPVLLLVPGGLARLAPLGGVMLLVAIASVMAFAGGDRILYTMYEPANNLQYMGLQSLQKLVPQPGRSWASIALPLVIAYQLTIVVWELRTDGPDG